MTLEEMMHETVSVASANGWYDEGRRFGEQIALLHSEVSEALEAYRVWGFADRTRRPELNEDGTLHHFKPEGVGSEFADLFIRLLDDCYRCGIDLEYEYRRKTEFNKTRGYKHGRKRL